MKSNVSATVLYQIEMALVKADFSVAIIKLTFKAFLVQTGISATRKLSLLEAGFMASIMLMEKSVCCKMCLPA